MEEREEREGQRQRRVAGGEVTQQRMPLLRRDGRVRRGEAVLGRRNGCRRGWRGERGRYGGGGEVGQEGLEVVAARWDGGRRGSGGCGSATGGSEAARAVGEEGRGKERSGHGGAEVEGEAEAEGASGGGAGAGGSRRTGFIWFCDMPPFVAWIMGEATTATWDPHVSFTNVISSSYTRRYEYARFEVARLVRPSRSLY